MSKGERNILLYLAIMALVTKLLRKNNPSKTVEKMLATIDKRFETARKLYPELFFDSKDCNRIEQKITVLEKETKIHIVCLTCICLAGFCDALDLLRGKRKVAIEKCIISLNRLSNYFDRKLNLNTEYDKAFRYIKGWS